MYSYEEVKPELNNEDSQRKLIRLYSEIAEFIKKQPYRPYTQYITMGEILNLPSHEPSSWTTMAQADRLVELGLLYKDTSRCEVAQQWRFTIVNY